MGRGGQGGGRRTLHQGWPNLDNLGLRPGLLGLRPQAVEERVQRRLGRRVGRDGRGGDQGQVGAGDDEPRRVGLGLEMGQELERHVDDAGEVRVDLGVERLEVDLGGLGERHGVLRAGVEEDAVEIGKRRIDPVAARQLYGWHMATGNARDSLG